MMLVYAMAIHVCCKCIFQMFHLFCMLQLFYLDVARVDLDVSFV
jgi:hypothetical protein